MVAALRVSVVALAPPVVVVDGQDATASSSSSNTSSRVLRQPPSPGSPVKGGKASKVSFMARCARRKLLVVYFGFGAYIVCLALWWVYGRGGVLAPESTNWLALHGKRLIRTPTTAGDGATAAETARAATGPPATDADTALAVKSPSLTVDDSGAAAAAAALALEPKLTCVGWRQTGGCDPNGPREAANDLPCDKPVLAGASGYCLLKDKRTGKEVRAMELRCKGLKENWTFRCNDAIEFANFKATVNTMTAKVQAKQVQVKQEQAGSNGIIMVMYPKLLVSVHATIRMLRAFNCTLPIELWFLESEMRAASIASNQILTSLLKEYGPVTLHGISESQIAGFNSKVYAIAYTNLANVLFLDADNVPVRDPTYLFETREFKETGAMFWPDFWHPSNTIFGVQHESILWELVDTPFVDMMEQESGQLLINRHKSAAALQILQLFAFHAPSLFDKYKLVHGDKDLFRLSWLKTNSSFHFIEYPPGSLGKTNAKGVYCGMTMVQFDPKGDVLFLHRNAKKLTGETKTARPEQGDEVRVWHQLETFEPTISSSNSTNSAVERYAAVKEHFRIGIYGGGDEFPETGMCYGEKREKKSGLFKTVDWQTLPFKDLEPTLLGFAKEAAELLNKKSET